MYQKFKSMLLSVMALILFTACSQVADTNKAISEAERSAIGAELEKAEPVEFEDPTVTPSTP